MPAALNVGLDGNNLDRILPEWEKQGKEIQILSFFPNMPQVSTKNFPHTKRVGNYLVGKMINKGSFAKVMEGLHIPTGQKVAMKVIDKKKARQDSYVLKNMKREPRIHQMIKHPNIVQLYETLETENSYYMVMELCLGGDLMDQICDKKKLLERDARKYTRQIMSAVEHLHRHGVVHRDLKIENFLLDENCNIKIVDFGLSNTIKFEGLSQELLSTQCGSPAYAAPELLANKKYGPKVDVWSIGVSMFAMLTGTLPFTVEPFNIKQLHQKMINGEISPIPPDISSGAVHFIHTLLEPDPAKRPTIKEAMENKWLNEGFIRKQLNSVLHKNRLRPDELNSIVLNYMTETMDLSISEVINILINNRPSPVMASYCLLLKKLMKHQKENKFIKKKEPDECNSHSTMLCLEPPETDGFTKKNPFQPDIVVKTQKQEDKCTVQTKEETQNMLPTKEVILQNEIKKGEKDGIPVLQETIIEDEIAITLENQENLPEASKFAGREFVFLEPPTSSKQKWDQVVIQPPPDKHKDLNELKRNGEKNKSPIEKQSTIFLSKANQPINNQTEHNDLSAEGSSYNIKVTYKSLNKPLFQSPFPQQQGTRLKEMVKSVDHNVFPPHSQQQEKESINLVMIETANPPPLPRLRQPALRDTLTKRISWVTTSHIPKSLSPPFVINGSRPPVFPVSRQHTIMVKNLRQSKEKTQLSLDSGKIKRNTVQLRQAHKSTNLNLPMLLPPYQKRSENKNEILRLEFV